MIAGEKGRQCGQWLSSNGLSGGARRALPQFSAGGRADSDASKLPIIAATTLITYFVAAGVAVTTARIHHMFCPQSHRLPSAIRSARTCPKLQRRPTGVAATFFTLSALHSSASVPRRPPAAVGMGLKISALERDLLPSHATSACSLGALPPAALTLILQLLSNKERLRTARCNRRLLEAVRSPSAWQCAASLPYPFYSAHWAARLRRSLLSMAPFELRLCARRPETVSVADLLLLPNIRAVHFDADAAATESQLNELLDSRQLADVRALHLSSRCQLRPHHARVIAERMTALRTLRLHCPEHGRGTEPDDDEPHERPGAQGSAAPFRPRSPTFDAVGSLLAPLTRMHALTDLSLSFPINLAPAGRGPAATLHPPLSHPLSRCTSLRRLRLHRAPLSEAQLADLLQSPTLARQLECLALSFVEASNHGTAVRANTAADVGAGTGAEPASSSKRDSPSAVDWRAVFGGMVRLRSLALAQCFIISQLLPALDAAPALAVLGVACRAQPLSESADCGAVNPAPAAVRALLSARPRLQVRLAVAPTLPLWLAPIRAVLDAGPRRHEREHCAAQWAGLRALAADLDPPATDSSARPAADHGLPAAAAVAVARRLLLVDRIAEADGEWAEEQKADARGH